MTTPHVTELPQRLEPVQPDPFIEAGPQLPAAGTRLGEREERERRLRQVGTLMRVDAGGGSGRNGSPAGRTERA